MNFRRKKELKIIIRDDDLNYSTTIEEVRQAYGDLLGLVPINFFVIPDLDKVADTYNLENSDFHWNEFRKQDPKGLIFDNFDLIEFLNIGRCNKSIGVGIHGFNHSFMELELEEKDIEYLESIIHLFKNQFSLNTLNLSFPNNSCSKTNYIRLSKFIDRFFVGYCHKVHERPLSYSSIKEFFIASFYYFTNTKYKYISSGERVIGGRLELSSSPISYVADEDDLDKTLDHLIKMGGTVCFATHYYDLICNEKTKNMMKKIVHTLLDNDAEFLNIEHM